MNEIRVVIPTFDGRLGKNEKLKRGRYGDGSIQQLKDSFITWIRAHARPFIGHEGLAVELIVYRPHSLYDAQNFGDMFWDLVAKALKVNDRNFASTLVTPQLDSKNPHFEIILRGE